MNFGTLGTGFSGMGRGGAGVGSAAAVLLTDYASGLAIAASDDSMVIKGAGAYAGTPGAKLTVSAGGGYFWASASLLSAAASNSIRRDYDPANGTVVGYLSEPAATDLFIRTDEIDNAAWTKSVGTVSANSGPDVYGTTLADKLIESAGAGEQRVFRSVSFTSGVKYAISVVLNAAEISKGTLFSTGANIDFDIRFDLVAGTIVQQVGAGTIQYLGRNLYCVTAIATATGTAGQNVQLRMARTLGTWSYTGDGVSGLYIHAFKATEIGYRTSYFPSAGSAASRTADVLTLATSLFPWSNTVGQLTITGRTARGIGSAKQVLWQCDDGSENNRVRIERNTSNEIHCIVSDGGVDQCDLNLGAVVAEVDFAVSFSWAANNFSASLNGGAAVTDSGGTIPASLTVARFGSSFTGEQWGGWINSVLYVPA